MKFITLKLVLAASFVSAAFATTAAKAQTALDVPFSFNVGGIVCPQEPIRLNGLPMAPS